jgi:hypothetical protein
MPNDETNKDLNQGANDGASGSGQAGNEGAGNEAGANQGQGDNNQGGAPSGNQPGSSDQGAGSSGNEEETITIPKKQYDQTLTDLDNYRTGLIGKKAKERAEGAGAGAAGDGGGQPADNQGQNGGGGNTPALGTMDETKVREIAVQASNDNLHKANQKTANQQFLKAHPEFLEDAKWQGLMTFFAAKRGKDTPDSILKDLEDAVLLQKRDDGTLDAYLEEQRKLAEQRGEVNAQVNMGRDGGGLGGKTGTGSAPAGVKVDETMASRFKNDPKEVAKPSNISPNPEGGFQIDVTQKK